MGEDLSMSIAGVLVAIRLYKFNFNRKEISSIVQELNEWTKELRKEKSIRELSNFVQFWQILVFGLVTTFGSSMPLPQSVFTMYSGRPYYAHLSPVDTSFPSAGFWIVTGFQEFTLFASTFASCLQECIINDMFMQLFIICRMVNEEIVKLREVKEGEAIDEEREHKKLLKIIQDVQAIER